MLLGNNNPHGGFMKKIMSIMVMTMAFTFSCSSDDGDESGGNGVAGPSLTFEGKTYKTVKIGEQVWMAENLNYDIAGSRCSDDPAICTKYGRHYTWSMAMGLPDDCDYSSCSSQVQEKHKGICPGGWHIPSDGEWITLRTYVENNKGCTDCASNYLKTTSGWDSYGNGEDSYGFAALPSGRGSGDGSSNCRSYWWSSRDEGRTAYNLCIRNDGEFRLSTTSGKDNFFSIRCVQD
jgi:uncharacterized protein (TIGR02145 family)